MRDEDEDDAAEVAAAMRRHAPLPAAAARRQQQQQQQRQQPRLQITPDLLQLLAAGGARIVGGPATAAEDEEGGAGANPARDNAALVAALERSGALTDSRVASALRAAPRCLFVPPRHFRDAHADRPIHVERASFNISAPHMHAIMLSHLSVQPGDRVLDVGCGTGAVSAAMAWLAGPQGRVHGIELRPWCVKFAREHCRRLREGAAGCRDCGVRGESDEQRRARRKRERRTQMLERRFLDLEDPGSDPSDDADQGNENHDDNIDAFLPARDENSGARYLRRLRWPLSPDQPDELQREVVNAAIAAAEAREGKYSDRAAPITFETHNAFFPASHLTGAFDRVHVGAACPEDRVRLLLRLLDTTREGQQRGSKAAEGSLADAEMAWLNWRHERAARFLRGGGSRRRTRTTTTRRGCLRACAGCWSLSTTS